jgi:hypothetical protein
MMFVALFRQQANPEAMIDARFDTLNCSREVP